MLLWFIQLPLDISKIIMINWNGVFPALTTKFNENIEIDIALYKKNLTAQIAAGVNGVILGGTLGEASTLTESEKEILPSNHLTGISTFSE